ncbi:hypothetical protein GIB67_033985 [Kingdonia uniflora]|uniref:Pyruvate phosphate dikinase AMP/ATP-binding domain-containing protein n=1 Tax=Kingdonia uniflora TaxID=39325 RepID=A0A7J7M5Y9_9MAGN|nr:hypothetical protein GIB67_033985 [Kingdonia uniflora]
MHHISYYQYKVREKHERKKVPSWVGIPTSIALPFGVFEKVLTDDSSQVIADTIQSLKQRLGGEDFGILGQIRKTVLQLSAPPQLVQELKNEMKSARMPWPGDEGEQRWEQAWIAIKKVWASKWNERAYFRTRKVKLDHDGLCMAVLVQEIINADYAFVVHTTNPSSEDSTEIYAKVVKGLGETLVGAYPGRGLSFVCYAGAGLYDSVPMDEEEKVVLDYSADNRGRAILLWTIYPAERDVFLANEATKGWTSSNRVLMEIACTRSSHEQLLARQAYYSCFKKSCEEDVAFHTTGDFCKLLVLLGSSYCYHGPEVNMTLAKLEAKILLKHISEKEYSHDDFIRILTTRSKVQLNATLNHYNNEFGTAITKDLKYESEDDFLGIVRPAINCLTCPEKYFEKVLRLGINKQGIDKWALTRVVTTRAEVNLKKIKEEYYKRNNVPLDRGIGKDTSEDYEKMLLALVGKDCV